MLSARCSERETVFSRGKESYGYPFLPDNRFHRRKRSLINRPLDSVMRNRVGERMDLQLQANFDNIEGRNAEPGKSQQLVVSSNTVLQVYNKRTLRLDRLCLLQ